MTKTKYDLVKRISYTLIHALLFLSFSIQANPGPEYNIILILTDDQSYLTLQHMPRLMRMAEQKGTIFNNAIVTNPECCPFRASMLSGGFDTHETGVKSNNLLNGSIFKFNDKDTIPLHLQKSGYATGFIGKYMHGYQPGYVPPGWTSFIANENGGKIKDYNKLNKITFGTSSSEPAKGQVKNVQNARSQYVTSFQSDEAIKFISDHGNDRFFLFLSLYAPHTPHTAEFPEDDIIAKKKEFNCNPPVNLTSKPVWYKKAFDFVQSNKTKFGNCGEPQLKGQVALLQSVDRSFEKIYTELDKKGLLDKTVIIFTSDNGVAAGIRELYPDKGMPYEEVLRVPFVVFHPGYRNTREIDGMVAVNLDIGATISELVSNTYTGEGKSITCLFEGKDCKRDKILIENYGYLEWRNRERGESLPPVIWSGLRSKKWKYIEYTTGESELYDLENDPHESQNVVRDEANATIVNNLAAELSGLKGLAITTTEIPEAYTGKPFKFQLQAWGGTKPYTWYLKKDSLPPGLKLRSDGLLWGIPEKPGKLQTVFTVESTNIAKHSGKPERFSWEFEINVIEQGN